MTLLAVGSVAFDDLETPSGKRENVLGGSVCYFSLSASRFHPVQIVAVAGEDFQAEHFQVFKGRPIDLEGLERKPGRCFHWKGIYGENLSDAQTIETHLNVFEDFRPNLPEGHRQSPFLFLGNIDPVLQLDVLRQMSQRPRWVALDTMNYWIQGASAALAQVLMEVDILLVNEGEARALSGERNLLKAFRKIRGMGPSILVVKRGEYGAMVLTDEGIVAVPAILLEDVVDPTGAGDTFAGGFLGYLAASGKLDLDVFRKAIIAGTVMASFAVQDFGIRSLEVATEQDIKDRTQAFSDMIRAGGL